MKGDQPGSQQQGAEDRSLLYSRSQELSMAQDVLYGFLLDFVKTASPDEVLDQFRQIFIHQVEVRNQQVLQAIYEIVLTNDRQSFFYTLKRCCFILINNWGSRRVYEPIQQLIENINDSAIYQFTYSRNLKKLRSWLVAFVKSKDYEELKVFAERYGDAKGRWSHRYTSYLLVPQYSDQRNPIEQRRAAQELAKQLRDRFRFDLAMYVAHSQVNPRTASVGSQEAQRSPAKNPTHLGDNVLRLIKMIVLRRGKYSYENLARLFVAQTSEVSYKKYKNALLKYLVFSVDNQGFVQIFMQRLSEKLEALYDDRDRQRADEELTFYTCNRVIEFLTTEDEETPTPLFNLLISQGGPLTLVVVLLKLVLIAPKTRNRLEYCIAKLIHHYEGFSSEECHWFINFLEVFSVTFAIYVEDVQYDLVRISSDGQTVSRKQPRTKSQDLEKILDDYRIFSQHRSPLRPTALEQTAEKAQEIQSNLNRLAQKSGSNAAAKSPLPGQPLQHPDPPKPSPADHEDDDGYLRP